MTKSLLEKPAVFVQVRYSSTRLPGKVLMKIENMTLLERLYSRLSFFLDLPIVFLTSTDPSDDRVVEHCLNKGIPVFRGDLNNVLSRFIEAGEKLGYEAFFRITGDNPFVDADAISEYWQKFMEFDYVDNIHKEGNVIGTGFEFVKLSVLKSIPNPISNYDQEHVTTYLRQHFNKYKSYRFVPEKNKKNEEVFLTCDYPEDFQLIKKVFNHFKYSNYIRVEEILSFVDQNKQLTSINYGLHDLPDY